MTDPGPFDNQVIGQSGNWVWIAMKGPQSAPFAYMAYFRHWNRIIAVNTNTDALRVFSIPPNTSQVSTVNTPPAFAQHSQTVYVGTGPWLGILPADPSTGAAQVIRPEPKAVVLKNQLDMLTGLQNEIQTGANGLTTFWNGYVMKDNQKDNVWPWEMQPALYNHGAFPPSVHWAVRFPLKQGSSAYQTRAKLYAEIEMLLNNPLDTAPIVYDTSSKLKQHFHSIPPAPIPGYTIKGGYYVKNGATGG